MASSVARVRSSLRLHFDARRRKIARSPAFPRRPPCRRSHAPKRISRRISRRRRRTRRVRRGGGHRAHLAARRRGARGRRRSRRSLVAWARGDANAAHPARIGKQHARRRDRRRRDRRSQPLADDRRRRCRRAHRFASGPGVLRADVDRAARAHGFAFRSIRRAARSAPIGGMASTNAAGSHSMHFGSMRSWVRAIDCVSPTDRARRSAAERRRRSDVARDRSASRDRVPRLVGGARRRFAAAHARRDQGFVGLRRSRRFSRSGDLVDLLVGSEGTLAFFAELELDLAPAAARDEQCARRIRVDRGGGDAAAVQARAAGAVACELLDRTFLDVAASGGAPRPVPAETESALLAEVEGEDADAAAAARASDRANLSRRGRDDGPGRSRPANGDRAVGAAPRGESDSRASSTRIFDRCSSSRTAPCRRAQLAGRTCAAFATILARARDARRDLRPCGRRARPRESARRRRAGRDWRDARRRHSRRRVALTASLGGTLTGEHGDGRLRDAAARARVAGAPRSTRFAP